MTRGFTLLEIVISMGMMLLIVAALAAGARSAYRAIGVGNRDPVLDVRRLSVLRERPSARGRLAHRILLRESLPGMDHPADGGDVGAPHAERETGGGDHRRRLRRFFLSAACVNADPAMLFCRFDDFGSRRTRAAFDATLLLVFSFLAIRFPLCGILVIAAPRTAADSAAAERTAAR